MTAVRSSRWLGAILAGGRSRRFGSDKAQALIDGRPMLDHVIAALAPQVDAMVICGRRWPGLETLDDYPLAGIGPLGGLGAALHHAARAGYAGVLTAPVDVLPVPVDLRALLGDGAAAVLAGQHLIGFWPVACRDPLVDYLLGGGSHAFGAWLERIGARRVPEPPGLRNVNRVDDLPPAGAQG